LLKKSYCRRHSTLERHVAHLRSRVEEPRLVLLPQRHPRRRDPNWKLFSAIPDGGHQSVLDRLRRAVLKGVPELVQARWTVEEIRRLGSMSPWHAHSHRSRLHAMARFANTAKVSVIRRCGIRRLHTVAFAQP
jgi:hypothetical protein